MGNNANMGASGPGGVTAQTILNAFGLHGNAIQPGAPSSGGGGGFQVPIFVDWIRDHWGFDPNPVPGPYKESGRGPRKYAPSHGPGSALGPTRPMQDPRPGATPLMRKLAGYQGGDLRGARQTLQAARRGELSFSQETSPRFPTAGGPVGVARRGSAVVGEFRSSGGQAGGRAYDRLQRINQRGAANQSPLADDWQQYRKER